MVIIGINAYHGDSSACLVKDGQLIAAAEEERFRRVKHWAGFPTEAVRYCLAEGGLRLRDVQFLAINQSPTANAWRKGIYTLKSRPSLDIVTNRIRNRQKRLSIAKKLKQAFPTDEFLGKVCHVEHHLAHLASAHSVSSFEDSIVVSVDGFGDFASSAWGIGRGNKIEIEGRIYFPHSLGIFYMALTQYLGFPTWGDEYKVMGLAPYGKPVYLSKMRKIILLEGTGEFRLNLEYFQHHRQNTEVEWEGGTPKVENLFSPRLEELLGPARKKNTELNQNHYDIARSVQAMYEEAFFNLLNRQYERHRLDRLTLSGGCAMNSVANGKVYRSTPFKKIYVQSAAGDAGGAIGAAYAIWNRKGNGRRFYMRHAYWGPSYRDVDINTLLQMEKDLLDRANCTVRFIKDEQALIRETAEAISDGLVIGWFQGRMEWGPRALGNRSIIGDPRRSDMKDILNLKIKRRESFRPFAPSILREAVRDWFKQDDDVPFMMQVYPIREEKQKIIPAVTHIDGSGRLQTVEVETNPRYHCLIKEFERITGVPIVLNTSFNENEPIVCHPKEALDCFLRTKMDVLVLGNWIVRRTQAS